MESGHLVEWAREENYVFKLNPFKERIEKWLTDNKVPTLNPRYTVGIRKRNTKKDNYSENLTSSRYFRWHSKTKYFRAQKLGIV